MDAVEIADAIRQFGIGATSVGGAVHAAGSRLQQDPRHTLHGQPDVARLPDGHLDPVQHPTHLPCPAHHPLPVLVTSPFQ